MILTMINETPAQTGKPRASGDDPEGKASLPADLQ